jgi:hypothetical protein
MSIFDSVSNKPAITIGNSFMHPTSDKLAQEKATLDEIVKQRAESLKKHNEALLATEAAKEVSKTATVLPGSVKVRDKSAVQFEEAKFSTKNDIVKYVNQARSVFENTLIDNLMMEAVGTIIVEACPTDDSIMENPAIRSYTTEMAGDIFKGLKQYSNYRVLAKEGKLPYFICELYQVAEECASVEALKRFRWDRVSEECGLETAKVNEFVKNEMANITLLDTVLNNHYSAYASMLVVENEDVIAHIRDKVAGELQNYQKTAEKIAEAKKSIDDAGNEKDPISGTTNGSEPAPPEGDNNGGETGSEPEGGSENNEGGTGDAPAEGGAPEGSEDTGSKEGSGSDSGKQPENSGGTEGGTGEKSEGEGGEDGKTSGDAGNSGTTAEGDSTEPEQKEGEVKPVSLSISEEIEDAASFASANSHTFNTGDEKFIEIHKKISHELIDAVNNGSLDKLTELKSQAKTAADKLRAISDGSNKKYDAALGKLEDLSSSISFEINKIIKNKVAVTESSRTIFENLVLNIGTRFKDKIAMENGIPEIEAVKYIPGDQVINEALIYQTTLEAFNTLKLLDLSNKEMASGFKAFIDSTKMKRS